LKNRTHTNGTEVYDEYGNTETFWEHNVTLHRLFPEECQKDADLSPPTNDDAHYESTKNREKLYEKKRIDLQFDMDNE